jgi:hypothetical protein
MAEKQPAQPSSSVSTDEPDDSPPALHAASGDDLAVQQGREDRLREVLTRADERERAAERRDRDANARPPENDGRWGRIDRDWAARDRDGAAADRAALLDLLREREAPEERTP